MRKLFLLLISIPSLLFCQPNFWSHYSLDFKPGGLTNTYSQIFYAQTSKSVIKSTDFGIVWDTIYTVSNNSFSLGSIIVNENDLTHNKLIVPVVYINEVTLYIFTDSGEAWNEFDLPTESNHYLGLEIKTNGDIYALYDTLYKSSDNGVTWEEVNAAPKNPDPDVHSSYSKIDIDPAGTIYMSVSSSEFIPPADYRWWENYYSSEDEGASWLHIIWGGWYSELGRMFTVREQDLFVNVSVSPYTFHYNKDFIPVIRNYPFYRISSAVINKFGLIYVTVSGVYYSNNDGDSWNEENSGLNSSSASSLLIDSLGYLYVATNEGIFKSNFTSFNFITDSAIVFEDTKIADTTYKSVTIINPYPFTLEIDSLVTYPNNFFITEIGNGSIDPLDSIDITLAYSPTEFGELSGNTFLYFNNISGKVSLFGNSSHPVGVEGNEEIIIDFALFQNFPNPFNPTTTIKYSVPRQSQVKLVIYNSLGEVMTTLVDQTKEKGNYVLKFNGENLSSGIYFYRMQAGEYSQVRKLILLK